MFAKFYRGPERLQAGGIALSHSRSKNRLMVVGQDPITRRSRSCIDNGQQSTTNSLCFADVHRGADHPIKNRQISIL